MSSRDAFHITDKGDTIHDDRHQADRHQADRHQANDNQANDNQADRRPEACTHNDRDQ